MAATADRGLLQPLQELLDLGRGAVRLQALGEGRGDGT